VPRVIEKTKNRAGKERACGKCQEVIQPGDRYRQWSFRYGGTHYRCMKPGCRPRPSDLTQSKMATVYSAQEEAQDFFPKAETAEEIEEKVREVGEAAQEIAEEYREAAEPFGGEGENAERAEELEDWAGELSYWSPDDEEAPIEEIREAAEEAIGECPL
jgi:hypothetical protein